MGCDSCKNANKPNPGPGGASQAVVEYIGEKFTKIIRWLCVLLLISLLGHIAWAVAWTSYDYASEETVVEAEDGIANYVRGNAGDIINGPDNRP